MTSILASIATGVGALIVLFNWYSLYASHRSGRNVSPAPLLGGLLLFLGLFNFPETRAYAWLAIVADYGTLIMVSAVPLLIRDAWSTCSFNLVHRFVSNTDGRQDDIRLFKRGKFTIRREHSPPVTCNEHGALSVSQGFVGVWHEEDRGFVLGGYGGDRILRILRTNGCFRTREEHYPENRKFPIDRLDALDLKKVT